MNQFEVGQTLSVDWQKDRCYQVVATHPDGRVDVALVKDNYVDVVNGYVYHKQDPWLFLEYDFSETIDSLLALRSRSEDL